MHVFPVVPSVTDATAIPDTADMMLLHYITVTCTINPNSRADMCEVMATANNQTLTGNEYEYMYTYIYLNTIHYYSRT